MGISCRGGEGRREGRGGEGRRGGGGGEEGRGGEGREEGEGRRGEGRGGGGKKEGKGELQERKKGGKETSKRQGELSRAADEEAPLTLQRQSRRVAVIWGCGLKEWNIRRIPGSGGKTGHR